MGPEEAVYLQSPTGFTYLEDNSMTAVMRGNDRVLEDALYNTSIRSGSSVEYARGIVVGIVSGKLHQGVTFDTAIEAVWQCAPQDYRPECFPDGWLDMIHEAPSDVNFTRDKEFTDDTEGVVTEDGD